MMLCIWHDASEVAPFPLTYHPTLRIIVCSSRVHWCRNTHSAVVPGERWWRRWIDLCRCCTAESFSRCFWREMIIFKVIIGISVLFSGSSDCSFVFSFLFFFHQRKLVGHMFFTEKPQTIECEPHSIEWLCLGFWKSYSSLSVRTATALAGVLWAVTVTLCWRQYVQHYFCTKASRGRRIE